MIAAAFFIFMLALIVGLPAWFISKSDQSRAKNRRDEQLDIRGRHRNYGGGAWD